MKIVLLLLLGPLAAFCQPRLVKMQLFDNHVGLMAPEGLSDIRPELWRSKYPDRPKPQLALSDSTGLTDLIGQYNDQDIQEEQLDATITLQVKAIKKSSPGISIVKKEVRPVNGKKVAVIKFLSDGLDERMFNCYFFTAMNGKLLFFLADVSFFTSASGWESFHQSPNSLPHSWI